VQVTRVKKAKSPLKGIPKNKSLVKSAMAIPVKISINIIKINLIIKPTKFSLIKAKHT
jgi:hypothetical protein